MRRAGGGCDGGSGGGGGGGGGGGEKGRGVREGGGGVKKLEAEIRNLDKDNVAEKNKIELKIEDYKLEAEEIAKQVPDNWVSKNKEFEIILKAKNTRTKRYRKNVDEAYDNLEQIAMFIKDYEKLNELSPEINNIRKNINNENYEKSI